MTQTVITAGDATSGASVVQGGNDGTMVLQVGPAGGKVNAIASDATGQVTHLKQPNVTTAQSMVRLDTANGYGSTNTVIRRFTNVITSQGSDITYADSAANGASFTINTNGVYAISYSDSFSTNGELGISLNSGQLTTSVVSITTSTKLSESSTGGGNACSEAPWTGYLTAGAVIRPHTSGTATGDVARVLFTITRVA